MGSSSRDVPEATLLQLLNNDPLTVQDEIAYKIDG
ncbi:hypothetical protein CCACVL1_11053 [Corchorus capsularis]|uniref:Uncharacterized protein n=1 Tax=Corchorus capsularis TaxID=210143 RepID=A0A1R3IN64_COCAP|nr:hypothetical protein CCACVL1_11053 [Corchorus capsularis]